METVNKLPQKESQHLDKVESAVSGHIVVGGDLIHISLEVVLVLSNNESLLLHDLLATTATSLALVLAGILPISLPLLRLVIPSTSHQRSLAHRRRLDNAIHPRHSHKGLQFK